MPTVSGILVYTCIQQPTLKYQDKVNKEYKVSVVVDEDTADDWSEKYNKQPAKAIRTSDFKNEFKIDPPFPGEKKQYVVTLKKDAQYKDGNPIPDTAKPKVFLSTGKDSTGKVTMKDVTQDKLVGNGSVGVVSFEEVSNDYGTFARLKNIRVDELVEYQQKGSGDSDLGSVEDSTEGEFDSKPETVKEIKKESTPSPRPDRKAAKPVQNVSDSDDPF
jgi:hypothetical protein